MKRINNITACALLLAAIILSGISCRDEVCETVSEPGEKEVTFSLALPADLKAAPGSTYLSEDEEKAIKNNVVTVLAFVKDGSVFKYKYKREVASASITQEAGSASASFHVNLMTYNKSEQRLVILANYTPPAIADGTSFENALESMTVSESSADEKWVGNALPMAAVIDKTFDISTETDAISINMIRMLARIDIKLKTSSPEVTNFTLVDARIYNRKTKGYVSYNYGAASWDNTNSKAVNAWVPDGAGTTNPTLETTEATRYLASSNVIERSIYTFEAAGVSDKKIATTIIVGGKYNGASDVTYYRVDIPQYISDVAQPDTYGDILRNHCYTIEIQSVSKAGAATPKAAFDGVVNVTATVTGWDLTKYPADVVIDNNQLKISKTQLRYDGVAKTGRTVKIIVPNGVTWTATPAVVSGSGSAPTLTAVSDGSINSSVASSTGTGSEQTLTFSLSGLSTGSNTKSTITVKAGNITKTINVFQYVGAAITLNSAGTSIGSGNTGIRTFSVTHRAPWTAAFTSAMTNCLLMTTGATFSGYGTWDTTASTSTSVSINKTTTATNPATVRFTSVDGEFGSDANQYIDYSPTW
ncbi:MAG: FimB/Mfa2 family fimbrial subunit [Prevotella sp.]|jgi:hypothetical protein|nr:FimB/Mfa2 family fimbrial subunit [Prevotella sp.]